jgi:hypothetical protein
VYDDGELLGAGATAGVCECVCGGGCYCGGYCSGGRQHR